MRLLWGVGAAAAVAVHPLHTTLTQLSYAAADRTVVVSVRAFADDFRAVAGDVSDSAAFGYLTTVLTLSDPAGRTLPLAWCGARRTGDLLWLCLHAPARGLAGLRVTPDCCSIASRIRSTSSKRATAGGRCRSCSSEATIPNRFPESSSSV